MMKIKSTPDSQVYFSSDFHLGHNRPFVWEARGHVSSEAHTDFVINVVNETVRPQDKLFFLGDFCLNTDETRFNEYLSRIQCQHMYMIWGNHSNPLRSVYVRETQSKFKIESPFEIYPFRYKNIIFIGNYAEILVDGQCFVLSHYPIHSWNMMSSGSIHLFGHLHCNNSPDTGRRMDVGWDGSGRPYSSVEILDIMNKRQITSDGGHH
jgi:calcineurin-like phosphoesterase family protein